MTWLDIAALVCGVGLIGYLVVTIVRAERY